MICVIIHIDGAVNCKCGSLQSNGLFVFDNFEPTTQLLDAPFVENKFPYKPEFNFKPSFELIILDRKDGFALAILVFFPSLLLFDVALIR